MGARQSAVEESGGRGLDQLPEPRGHGESISSRRQLLSAQTERLCELCRDAQVVGELLEHEPIAARAKTLKAVWGWRCREARTTELLPFMKTACAPTECLPQAKADRTLNVLVA